MDIVVKIMCNFHPQMLTYAVAETKTLDTHTQSNSLSHLMMLIGDSMSEQILALV